MNLCSKCGQYLIVEDFCPCQMKTHNDEILQIIKYVFALKNLDLVLKTKIIEYLKNIR